MFRGVSARPPYLEQRAIVGGTQSVMSLANEDDIDFARRVDFSFQEVLFDVLLRNNVLQTFSNIHKCKRHTNNFLRFVIYCEKQKWQIDRPYVIAEKLNIPFERKYISQTASDTSYPSGHAAGSRFFVHCMLDAYDGEINDYVRAELFNVSNRVALSRVQIGVHSLQDIREGIRLADEAYLNTPLSMFNLV